MVGVDLPPWQAAGEVLLMFNENAERARQQYESYLAEGVAIGKRPDLIGGGLLRSSGGRGQDFRSVPPGVSRGARVRLGAPPGVGRCDGTPPPSGRDRRDLTKAFLNHIVSTGPAKCFGSCRAALTLKPDCCGTLP